MRTQKPPRRCRLKKKKIRRLCYGLPWWLGGIESACNMGDYGFDPRVGKIPWRRKRQPTPVFLLGKFYGQRSLAGYRPWGHKESDTTEHADNSKVLANQPDAGWGQFIPHSGLVHHINLEEVWLWNGVNAGNTADVFPLVVEMQLWLWAWWYHERLKNTHLSASFIPGTGGAQSQQAQTTRGKCGGPLSPAAKEGIQRRKLCPWEQTLAYTSLLP